MIVLATYMGGLAFGAFYFGKYADKVTNPMRLYGLIELGVGGYCLAYPIIINVVGELFIDVAATFDGSFNQNSLLALKFSLSFGTLIIPTFLMGGTLPILIKYVCKNIADSGKDVAVLYFVNSLGAIIGTALCGFYLIRIFGVEKTVYFTGLCNILIGVVAFVFSKWTEKTAVSEVTTTQNAAINLEVFPTSIVRVATIAALVSGFIAMLYELAWIRLLSNILGSTTYSFTLMLLAFISGIALGSFVVSLIVKRIKNLVFFLAVCQLGTAFSMILMLPLYERLPYYLMKFSSSIGNSPEDFNSFLRLEFFFCFMIMVIPSLFSGMSLPVVSRIANSDLQFLGKSIGGVFSINTLGSVLGALLTGLLFIPFLGVKMTLELGVVLNGILGIIILSNTNFSKKVKLGFSVTFLVLMIGYKLLFPTWNQNFLISGVFRVLNTEAVSSYAEFVAQQNEGQKILWYKEGVNANVAIRESNFEGVIQKTLVINGKADASSVADLQTQVLLGQIPLMLYTNKGNALVIGLGSGITCGSVLRHPIKSLDVVEIAAEVVECNSFFKDENYDFTKDPRVKIHIDDAITQLKTTQKKYDYIISEPSNPWIAGISNLYTVDFFELCKKRMTKSGVLAQWFHTYDVNNDLFQLVLSTVCKVFPHVTIWKASDADIIILATSTMQPADFRAMEQKMKQPKIANDLARIKMFDVPSLLSTQVVSARNNPYVFMKKEVNTTDKSALEFLAPISLFTHESLTVLDSIDERFSFQDKNLLFSDYSKRSPLSFENYKNIGLYRTSSNVGDYTLGFTALRKAMEIKPNDMEVQNVLAQVSAKMGLPDLVLRNTQLAELKSQYESNPTDESAIFEYLNALVEYYRIDNSIVNPQQMDDVVDLLKRAIQIATPSRERFQYILGMVYTGAGRYEEANDVLKGLLLSQKTNGSESIVSEKELVYTIGECYYNTNKLVEAAKCFKRVQVLDPTFREVAIMHKKIQLKKKGIR
jgi:spermidine synthase